MEYLLFSPKSTFDTWLNSSYTAWTIEIILAVLCGLGLFFLFLPCHQNNPSFPRPRKHGTSRKVRNPWPRPTSTWFSFLLLCLLFWTNSRDSWDGKEEDIYSQERIDHHPSRDKLGWTGDQWKLIVNPSMNTRISIQRSQISSSGMVGSPGQIPDTVTRSQEPDTEFILSQEKPANTTSSSAVNGCLTQGLIWGQCWGPESLTAGARVGPWLREAKTYLMELRFSNTSENMRVPSAEQQWQMKSRVGLT